MTRMKRLLPTLIAFGGEAYKSGLNSSVFLEITSDGSLKLLVPNRKYVRCGEGGAGPWSLKLLRLHLGSNLKATGCAGGGGSERFVIPDLGHARSRCPRDSRPEAGATV